MQIRRRICRNLYCLVVVIFALSAGYGRANTVQVEWDSLNGFYVSQVTINAGDEVDFYNVDITTDLILSGNDPASFSVTVPYSPDGGMTFYYYPHVYNNPGTFTADDGNAGTGSDTVTINVNSTALSVAIVDPTNNAAFFAPATFSVTAQPAGGVTPYADVEFLVGTNDVADVTNSPFSATVTNLSQGIYTISAIVIDNNLNTATNSILVDVLPPPGLTAARAGNQIVVSWPTNNPTPTSLALETSTNLGPGASWTPVSQIPAAMGDQWTVTNPVSGARMFFRLSSQ